MADNSLRKGRAGMEATEPGVARGIAGRIMLIFFLAAALLLFLSLISYDPRDTDCIAGGIQGDVIRNWIGYLGACVSWGLLLLFGFAAYPVVVLMLLSFGRRLLSRSQLRPVGWDYWVALGLVAIGGAMFFGIWPDLWETAALHLNITRTPGGVLGQLLTAPAQGWMRMILNPVGSAIVAGTLTLIGVIVLWIYDWHALLVSLWSARGLEVMEGDEAVDQPGALQGLRDRLAARKAAREEQKRRRAADEAKEERVRERQARSAAEQEARARQSRQPGLPAAASELSPLVSVVEGGAAKKIAKTKTTYKLPGPELLHEGDGLETTASPEEIEEKKRTLQQTLDSFGIDAVVGATTSGPRVTLFEVETAPGVKVERISRISNNIAMELRAVSLRILTPIPGRKSVGIEVPNANPATVHIRNLMDNPAWTKGKADIPLLIGRNISGKCVVLDLAKAPHLLIAGATGSGKSVSINAMIMSLLYRFTPAELRMILVDPKVVEFSCYNCLPHLVVPVITESKKVPLALRWVINEMEKRYQVFSQVGARNLAAFNARPKSKSLMLDDKGQAIPDKMPYVILVIDELADIMMTARGEVETSLTRIAQLSRATGIHTIIATQRPSVNVITGTIKANYPTRIAFQVTSQVDSRTILDHKGAESLLGRGDMLFKPPGASKMERIQSALVEDDEIELVAQYVASQAEQEFDMTVFKSGEGAGGDSGGGEQLSSEDEELIAQAIDIIRRDRRATTSYLQRCMRIGYNRAALIMEILEDRGIIGPQVGTAPREVLIDTATGMTSDDIAPDYDEAEAEPDIDDEED